MKWDAIIRYHYGVNPEMLNEQEYWELIAEYKYAKEIERNALKGIFLDVASTIIKAIHAK